MNVSGSSYERGNKYRNIKPGYRNPLFRSLRPINPIRSPFVVILVYLTVIISIGIACNAPGTENSISQTKVAMDREATSISQNQNNDQESSQNQETEPTATETHLPQVTENAEETQALLDTQRAIQPTPTPTPTIEATNTPTASSEPPTDTPSPTPTQDLNERIKSSKILLFEDIVQIYEPRYIKQALDGMGLSGNVTDVKDALGNFKSQLLSGTNWDLVIAGVESRAGVQGEFFIYLNDLLLEGTAVIIEHWNLDDLSAGQISNILTRCGINVQADWWDPPYNARSIWWLIPDHPIFHEPNEGISLANYSPFWSVNWPDDAGDLIQPILGNEDVLLLAGTLAQEKNSHGTLATCLNGLLILQTFSSHDYHQDDMVALWQNYIFNALRSRFDYQDSE